MHGDVPPTIFHGSIREPPFMQVIGGWDDREYATLSQEQRSLIAQIASGAVGDKQWKCTDEHHPLWETYQATGKSGLRIIEQQLSDARILLDMRQFLQFLTDAGRVHARRIEDVHTLPDVVISGIAGHLKKVRLKCEALIQEAVLNVIQHGMKHDPRGVGVISVGMNDHGNFDIATYSERAFDYAAAVAAALKSENMERTSGRGVLYITSLPDEHCYSENGRCLLMRFHLRQKFLEALLRAAEKRNVDIALDASAGLSALTAATNRIPS